MARAQDGVLATDSSSFSKQKQSSARRKQGDQLQETTDEVCRKVSFIKQKSGRYIQMSQSFLHCYPKTLAPLIVEMLAFHGTAQAPHGLHPGEARA
jgi:hypothetical protein